jgi:tRNA G10  N-methylase Trm11
MLQGEDANGCANTEERMDAAQLRRRVKDAVETTTGLNNRLQRIVSRIMAHRVSLDSAKTESRHDVSVQEDFHTTMLANLARLSLNLSEINTGVSILEDYFGADKPQVG